MKAYSATDKNEWMFSTVVFAETAGKARAIAQQTDACEDVDFTDIYVKRIPALDRFYRGKQEMDWYDPDDRAAMVRYGNFECSREIDVSEEKCSKCSAAEWCGRYEGIKEDEANGQIS